jgi:hypothetical protein
MLSHFLRVSLTVLENKNKAILILWDITYRSWIHLTVTLVLKSTRPRRQHSLLAAVASFLQIKDWNRQEKTEPNS